MPSTKYCQLNDFNDCKLPDISSEILEVKKRIQLSEGQRKALFEEIESRKTRDADEMLRLKKEIAALTSVLHEQRANFLTGLLPFIPPPKVSSAPCRKLAQHDGGFAGARSACSTRMLPEDNLSEATMATLRSLIGARDKSFEQIVQHLNLQRIDKNKQLDLLNYRYKQKEGKLKQLAEEYEKQLRHLERDAEDADRCRHEAVVKTFRNRINALQVQIRQAEYVRTRYREIRTKLVEDAAKFESKVRQVEEDLRQQDVELEKMKQANLDDARMRANARSMLQKEQREVIAANDDREKQSAEEKRLVEAQMSDLEKIERYTDNTKVSMPNPDTEVQGNEEDEFNTASNVLDPIQEMQQNVEILKGATGSTSLEEVLEKVKEQISMKAKLTALRNSKENVKKAKQVKYDAMLNEFENMNFTEEGSKARARSECLDEIHTEIQTAKSKTQVIRAKIEVVEQSIEKIVAKLCNTYMCISRGEGSAITQQDPLKLIQAINNFIKATKKRERTEMAAMPELLEEALDTEPSNWLPEPYNIVRRTPQPISNVASPAPPERQEGSDDDDELPTRAYLKRQAQLVVDAKNKRKPIRFQMTKSK